MVKLLLSSLAIILVSGCTARIGDFTAASTKNIDLRNGDFVIGERVEGRHDVPIVIVPLGVISMKDATDNAIQNNRCAVGLTDVVIDNGFVAFIIGSTWYKVEGNLLIDKSIPGCEDWTPNNDPLT